VKPACSAWLGQWCLARHHVAHRPRRCPTWARAHGTMCEHGHAARHGQQRATDGWTAPRALSSASSSQVATTRQCEVDHITPDEDGDVGGGSPVERRCFKDGVCGEGLELLGVDLHDREGIRESPWWRNGDDIVLAIEITERGSWRWCDTSAVVL
jgi:hypothetical protein